MNKFYLFKIIVLFLFLKEVGEILIPTDE